MRVWQPGSYMTRQRGAEVDDWSWKTTVRRVTTLARLTKPYKLRTALALLSLLAATATGLAPPYLAGMAVNRGIEKGDMQHARHPRDRVPRGGNPQLARRLRADVLHRLDGRADPGRPAQPALPPSAAALARLLRAEPRRRDHLPTDERRRGDRPARHRRRDDARPEHAHALRDRDHPLHPRLAARPRDAGRPAVHVRRDGDLPHPRDARLQRGAREARDGDRDARGGHRRHARRPVLQPRAPAGAPVPPREPGVPGVEPADGRPERPVLPVRRLPLVGGDRDRPRLRRLPLLPRRDPDRDAVRLHALPVELLRPGAAALPALQHVPLRRRRAGQDHGRDGRGARGAGPQGRARASRASRGTSASRTSVSATGAKARRCCTGSTWTFRREPPSRSSATRAPASPRSRSSSPASTTPAAARSRSTRSTSAT